MYIARGNKYRYKVEWVCNKKCGKTEKKVIHVTGLNGTKIKERSRNCTPNPNEMSRSS